LLKTTFEDCHLAVVAVGYYIACLLTIELTLTLITFGLIYDNTSWVLSLFFV